MARINTPQLVDNATNLGYRALKVQHDPAVQKAGTQMVDDAKQAGRSTMAFAYEVAASWRRHGADSTAAFTGFHA